MAKAKYTGVFGKARSTNPGTPYNKMRAAQGYAPPPVNTRENMLRASRGLGLAKPAPAGKRTGTAAKGGQSPRGGGRGGAPNKRIPGTTRRFMVNKKTGVARYTGTYDKRGNLMTGKRTGINARTGRTG